MLDKNESRAVGGNPSTAASGSYQSACEYTTKSNRKSIPVMRADGKTIGKVVGGVFIKRIRQNHFLQKPRAIASDVQSLLDAQRAGAEWMEVENMDTGTVYRCSIHKFLQTGKLFDRGYGKQIYLPLGEWSTGDEQVSQQLSLAFGGAA